MKKITVLLADDHTVVRTGLRRLLEAAEDIEVLGEAENGHKSVREAKRLQPDVVLLDISMPLLNGMEAARQIAKEVPSAKVLILSAYSDDQYVRHAVEAGAAGYLMKETAANDLLRAIREIAKGNAFFSPPVARHLLRQWKEKFLNGKPVRTKANTLTSREMEVIQLIAEGYASKQIAGVLSLSIKTVEKHRQTLMEKLDIHNIANLTRYAISSGVVESSRAPELARRVSEKNAPAREQQTNNHQSERKCGENICKQRRDPGTGKFRRTRARHETKITNYEKENVSHHLPFRRRFRGGLQQKGNHLSRTRQGRKANERGRAGHERLYLRAKR